jgi:hypothetical protein
MTKDDIIRMAHKAGFLIDIHAQQYQPNCILSTYGLIDENLERFANLVAAAQRPWVGLEAEEILDLFDRNNVYGSKWIEFARTVEAKLKERNT